MTLSELKSIMQEIHDAKKDADELAKERDGHLRQLVHDNISVFQTLWDLLAFCRETTESQSEYNAVAGRLLKTWKNYKYGRISA